MISFRKTLVYKPIFPRRNYNVSSKVALLLLLPKQIKKVCLILALILIVLSIWYIRKVNFRHDDQQRKPLLAQNTKEDLIEIQPEFCDASLNTNKDIALDKILVLKEEAITTQINQLEKEIENTPQNSCLLNNLAAIYFIRGYKRGGFSDFIHSLSLLDKALTITPNFTEASFNQALVLQNLYLSSQAKLAWQEYLKQGKDKDQLAKANKQLLALADTPITEINRWEQEISTLNILSQDAVNKVQRLVLVYPHQARNYVLNQLLAKWANAYLTSNNKTANECLWLIQQIGNSLFFLQKDNLINDLVKNIHVYSDSNLSKYNLTALAKAYIVYQKANEAYNSYQVTAMSREINESQDIFIKLNDKAGEVLITLLTTKWDRNYLQAISKLEAMSLIAEKNNYPYLLALIWGNIGSFQGHLFQTDLALNSQNKALKYFEVCGDLEGVVTSHFIISEILSQINDKEQIFFHQKKVLSILSKSANPIKKALFLAGIGSQLQKLAEPQAAIYFHNEAVSLSMIAKDHVVSVNTLLRRSVTHYYLGYQFFAINDFKEAKMHCSKISDPLLKSLMEEYLNIIEADYKLVDDTVHAIKLLSSSLKTYKNYADRYYLTHIYQSRAKAYNLLGNRKLAVKDLISGISEFEKERKNISEQGQRITFFEDSQSIYEQMVEMQIEEGNIELAFNYAEKARARGLLDIINTSKYLNNKTDLFTNVAKHPFSISQIQGILPNNRIIIEYCVMEKQTLAWVISKNRVDLVKIIAKQSDINKIIQKIRDTIENNDQGSLLKSLCKELYGMIINPLVKQFPPSANLVIVGDKSLNNIPFSILINPNTNRYLIQDWAVSYAPSATIFSQCLIKDNELIKKDDKSILVIGNSAFDKNSFSQLPSIPFATTEANQINDIYDKLTGKDKFINFTLLLNKTATKKAFYNIAREYSIIHFAGHAIENENFPVYSQLVFAPESIEPSTIDNSVIYAYELYRFHFTKTRLAILSACRTGSGQNKLGEGNISLARSFLAAGIPAVIASSWQIDDQLTAEFFVRFHKRKISGQNSLEALREVQNEFITSSDSKKQSPVIWGVFMLLGG